MEQGKILRGSWRQSWRVKKEPASEFAGRLMKLREDKGIARSEVAEAVSVARSTITKYEGGAEAPYGTLMRVARCFNVGPNHLAGWTTVAHRELSGESLPRLLEAHGKQMYGELMQQATLGPNSPQKPTEQNREDPRKAFFCGRVQK